MNFMKRKNIGMDEYSDAKSYSAAIGEKNDCAVVAVSLTRRVPYQEAHDILKILGRRRGRSTPVVITSQAVNCLGFKIKEIKNCRQSNGSRYTPRTIGQRLKCGYYLCRVRKHIFAVVNGNVLDWSAGSCQRITNVYKVVRQK